MTSQPPSNSQMPSVAVVLITYNHEPFIAQSIESVFAQRYDGLIHLIVSDDCSTDRTQEVISLTVPRAPANIVVHPVLRTSNVGAFKNFSDAWAMAHETGSRYIALLDGDDYWTDPWKLALQVGYLDQHPRATLSFGLTLELVLFDDPPTYEIGIVPRTNQPTFDHMLWGLINFIATPTVLYRAGIVPTLPEWFFECGVGDRPLHLMHARAGDMHYLDRVVAVHRQHAGGGWTAMPPGDQAMVREEVRRLAIAHLEPTTRTASMRFARDHDLLLAEVERNPEDLQSVILLAQSCFDQGDFANARKWYARRLAMGTMRSTEEDFLAMYLLAMSMQQLGEPWPDVQDAYLKAWAFRPIRAEPLYRIARRHREDQRYQLGYLFARWAAEIPFPEGEDLLFTRADFYPWAATDEQAVCASWIGKHAEAFTLCRRLLARPDIPDGDRQRIAGNRDVSVPAMLEAASSYPDALVGSVGAGPRDAEVTVSLVAGPDRAATEQTLNSFLHCCTDVAQVGRFLVLDAGLSAQDRAKLGERYGFLEFADPGPGDGPGAHLAQLRAQIHGRFWLHLDQGWQFFAPENLITRLTAVLETEPQALQVGINFADAAKLTGACAAELAVRRAPTADAGRYVLADVVASGPAMFDTARLDQAGGVERTDPDPIAAVARRAAAARLRTASLDEVLCIAS